jgi:RecA-family ATPase
MTTPNVLAPEQAAEIRAAVEAEREEYGTPPDTLPTPDESAQAWSAATGRLLAHVIRHGQAIAETGAALADLSDDWRPSARLIWSVPAEQAVQVLLDHGHDRVTGQLPDPGSRTTEELVRDLRQARNDYAVWVAVEKRSRSGIMQAIRAHDQETDTGWMAGINPATVQAGRYLEVEPPPLDWVFMFSLLSGTVGFLVGAPGTGKSTLLIILALSVASGQNLTGQYDPQKMGSVLAVFAEEDDAILHRRTRRIARELGIHPGACNRFYAVPAAGHDIRLVKRGMAGNIEETQAFQDLRTLAKKIDNLRLIIVDPLSRLYGLDENGNGEPTIFVAMLEQLAQETGAAILVSHHTKKADRNAKSYKNALEAEAMRGASAFIGAARWQMNLTTLTVDEAKKTIGDRHPEPGQYLAGRTSKKNYSKPEDEFFLERGEGGVLRPITPAPGNEIDDYGTLKANIIETVRQLDQDGTRLTKSQLSYEHGSSLGASRAKIQNCTEIMIQNGELHERRERSGPGKKYAYYLTLQP